MNPLSTQIKSGPCKRLLATALVELVDGKPIEVEFQSDYALYRVIIQSMEMEDGSRESWNLVGITVAIGRQRLERTMKAKIYFNTRRRAGSIELTH